MASWPSLVGTVPKPSSHSSILLAEVHVPLPHFSCSSVWGPMWPWLFSLQSTPISYAPCEERCPSQEPASRTPWVVQLSQNKKIPRPTDTALFINTAMAQVPGRHNAPGQSINFILNQLSARFTPSSC